MTNSKRHKNRAIVYVAMSGGVDSAVAAALLKEDDYSVTGVFMKNWSGDVYGIQTECPWEADQRDVEDICRHLNITFKSFNFEKQYRAAVVDYFFSDIKAGRTPNPDVVCNREIKFKIFLDRALRSGADFIATGHYARIDLDESSGEYSLLKGIDTDKDQSYFLHLLTQKQLAHSLFPIGEYRKQEVRELAKDLNLPVADKPDSQGICFIGEINVREFIKANVKTKPGAIIDLDTGRAVGEHEGSELYTVGQRKGLGVGGSAEPYYVVSKDKDRNILYVAMGSNNPALYTRKVAIEDLYLINKEKESNNEHFTAAVRYRQVPSEGSFVNAALFEFDEPQRAVASGQSIVFYRADHCLGGGVIK